MWIVYNEAWGYLALSTCGELPAMWTKYKSAAKQFPSKKDAQKACESWDPDFVDECFAILNADDDYSDERQRHDEQIEDTKR